MRPLGAVRVRPAGGGLSVGTAFHDGGIGQTSGSLGAIVTLDADASQHFILSCNHVLSLNDAVVNGMNPNPNILQPAFAEDMAGVASNVIATVGKLNSFCSLTAGLNNGDFAIAKVRNPTDVTPGLPPGVPPLQHNKPLDRALAPNRKVFLFGNKSGRLRTGVVAGAQSNFSLSYPALNATFNFVGQLPVVPTDGLGPLSDVGDCGTLAVTEDGFGVGIVFANRDTDAMISPLDQMFATLGLSFVL
jgi:hypothetical protein